MQRPFGFCLRIRTFTRPITKTRSLLNRLLKYSTCTRDTLLGKFDFYFILSHRELPGRFRPVFCVLNLVFPSFPALHAACRWIFPSVRIRVRGCRPPWSAQTSDHFFSVRAQSPDACARRSLPSKKTAR